MAVFTTYSVALLGLVISSVNGQYNLGESGVGPPKDEIWTVANQNPLNKTSVTFDGFNFSADPVTTGNLSGGQWTWTAGLAIINTNTNQTNFPIASAANTTSNILDLAYTLDFPDGQLPTQNETDWTMCSYSIFIPWSNSVLSRASNDPGDCSVVLGSSCLQAIAGGFTGSADNSTKCPITPDITGFSECSSISTNGYQVASGPVNSFHTDYHLNSSVVGLKSGQIFTWEVSSPFNGSDAMKNYDAFASQLWMNVLTFGYSPEYELSTNSARTGEVRTFCTVLNKGAPRVSSGMRLRTSHAGACAAILSILLFVW